MRPVEIQVKLNVLQRGLDAAVIVLRGEVLKDKS